MALREHRLQILSTLGRRKEPFTPRVAGQVGIYVCGPTVYSDAHLGHAKSYVSFDVVVRYLRHLGYRVKYVQNITDVGHLVDDGEDGEDKIERLAKIDKVHPLEIAERITRGYFKDLEWLGVRHADLYPRATQHIPEQIELIERLIEKGHAYAVEGNVYFSVKSWPRYGELSGRQVEDQRGGARVAVRDEKRDPRDFALWKRADGGHIQWWRSPWGKGYPGWHIECSAMSMKYLGDEFDIHGGGLENQFPHHECEIAQSCAATGGGFARYWLHNNMINRDGQKMSKSLGNGILIRDLPALHAPETVRTFLLGTHYRSPANYTDEGLKAAEAGWSRLVGAWRELDAKAADAPEATGSDDARLDAATRAFDAAFHAAMDDDFNTPVALAACHGFLGEVRALLGGTAGRAAWRRAADAFRETAGDVLGLLPEGAVAARAASVDLEPVMKAVLDVRRVLRERKLFDVADVLRNGLGQAGIEVKDTKDGAVWSKK
ncbi:MAG TPA: cysteine--tRNA ligase [Planctomycetota bacterium]|nr:cysteine--tRNA ligase [Planctomycetota bacterium]